MGWLDDCILGLLLEERLGRGGERGWSMGVLKSEQYASNVFYLFD